MSIKERYLAKQKELKYVSVSPRFPRILKIDICNICNYNCIFCPQSKQINKIGCIDDNLCIKIIKDAYEAGARELCLSSTGEPLLNPNLEFYAAYARNIGYEYIFFNTNGYLLDERRANKIITEGAVDSIKLSINADEKSYYLVHGVDGFQKVISNLKNLYNIRNKEGSKCKISVSYVAVKQTRDEAESLRNKISDICDEFMVMNANNRAGSISEVDGELYAGRDEYSYSYPCSQLFNNAYVTAEGYLIACGQDFENQLIVGDLNKENIKNAWNNENFTELRKKYLDGNIKGLLCFNCINGCSEEVRPLNKELAGYKECESKKKALDKRIEELISRVYE